MLYDSAVSTSVIFQFVILHGQMLLVLAAALNCSVSSDHATDSLFLPD